MHRFTALVLVAVAGVLAAPAAAPAADFSSGLGCAANCVQSAIVQSYVSFGRIDVSSDTPARFEIVVRKRTAMDTIVWQTQSAPTLTKQFGTFITGLAPDTLYAIAVTATDAQGRHNTRLGTFRSKKPQTTSGVNGANTFSDEATCATQCITNVDVTPGVTAAKFAVRTNVGAKLEVAIDDGPRYDATASYRTDLNATLRNLRSGRRYRVVVKATDTFGNTATAEGTFDTLQRNVRVRFMEIRVTENGEKSSLNRGEMSFVGGVNRGWQVKRGRGKVKDGQRIHFSNQGQVELFDAKESITFEVQGDERDKKGICFDATPNAPFSPNTGSLKVKCVKKTWNTATAKLDLASIFALDSSVEPGFEGAGTRDTTIYANGGGVRFYVDVRVDVWTE